MPLDRLFRKEAQEVVEQDDMLALALRERIVEVREELEVYETSAWAKVDEILQTEMNRAYGDMMAGDPEQMVLARERARVVSRLRGAPDELRRQLAELQRQVLDLEGADE